MEVAKKLSITLDLKQTTVIPLPQFIQNDTNILELKIKFNGVDADLSNITRIVVNYKRPDKKVISRLLTATGNTIVYEIGLEEMEVPGLGEMEIQFFENDQRISTKRFKVNMLPSIGTDTIYENTEQLTVLQELFVEVETVKVETETARVNAEAAATAANTAATNAQQVADENKTRFLPAVSTVADRDTAYPTPAHGDTVRVTGEARMYRFVEGSGWILTDEYNPTAIDEVNVKLAQNTNLYKIDITKFGIKNDGMDSKATTDGLNNAIQYALSINKRHIRLDTAGTYLIKAVEFSTGNIIDSRDGVVIPSNCTFEMADDVILKVEPNSSHIYTVLNLKEKKNVTVIGGKLIGDREEHTYTSGIYATHEHGHGIWVYDSQNIKIDKMDISMMTGDGILMQGATNKNIEVCNGNFYQNRRNNLSVVEGSHFSIHDNTVSEAGKDLINSTGTAPRFGIDIEAIRSEYKQEYVEDIHIFNNIIKDNVGVGVCNYTGYNVFIDSNTFINDNASLGYGAYCRIANNNFISTASTKTAITSLGNSTYIFESENNIVENNVIKGYNKAFGINIKGVTIRNNTITSCNILMDIQSLATNLLYKSNNSNTSDGITMPSVPITPIEIIENKIVTAQSTSNYILQTAAGVTTPVIVNVFNNSIIGGVFKNLKGVINLSHNTIDFLGVNAFSDIEFNLNKNKIINLGNFNALYSVGNNYKLRVIGNDITSTANSLLQFTINDSTSELSIINNTINCDRTSNGLYGLQVTWKDASVVNKNVTIINNTIASKNSYHFGTSLSVAESTNIVKVVNNAVYGNMTIGASHVQNNNYKMV